MYTTDAQIKQDVADALKVASVSDLPAYWDNLVARCHVAAYQEIVGALLARGFTQAQIDAWDRGTEFERHLALYFCFTWPQGAGQFDLNAVKLWDRREELKAVQIYYGGAAVDPSASPGTIGAGRIRTDVGVFNPIGIDDDNPAPMQW